MKIEPCVPCAFIFTCLAAAVSTQMPAFGADTSGTRSFKWNPAIAQGEWNDAANWLLEDGSPAEEFPSDAARDVALFDSAARVELSSPASASNVCFRAPVTLAGSPGSHCTLTAAAVAGDAVVTLADSGFSSPNNVPQTNSVNIAMTPGTTNWFCAVSDVSYAGAIHIQGNISGAGCYKVRFSDTQGGVASFGGDNNGFCGDMYTEGGATDCVVRWEGENAGGTNTFVHIGHSAGLSEPGVHDMARGSVSFGGFDGAWFSSKYTVVTVGALGRDSRLSAYWDTNKADPYVVSIVKTGAGRLDLARTRLDDLTIREGTVSAPVGIALWTLTVDDGARLLFAAKKTWATGNVVTLLERRAVVDGEDLPEAIAVTGLPEGQAALVEIGNNAILAEIVAGPWTDSPEECTVTRNGDGSFNVALRGETAKMGVPDGAAVSKVSLAPSVRTALGVPGGVRTVLALESGEHEIISVDAATGAVALAPEASASVDGETIAVRPEFSDAGDEIAPLAMAGSPRALSIGVKTIPGLRYSLVRAGSPRALYNSGDGGGEEEEEEEAGSDAEVVAVVDAAASRTALTDPDPPAGAAFYAVRADLP